MSIPLSIRLPDEIAKNLEQVASLTERPKAFIVKRALEVYLTDYADYQIALDRLRDKDDAIISASDLRKKLGL